MTDWLGIALGPSGRGTGHTCGSAPTGVPALLAPANTSCAATAAHLNAAIGYGVEFYCDGYIGFLQLRDCPEKIGVINSYLAAEGCPAGYAFSTTSVNGTATFSVENTLDDCAAACTASPNCTHVDYSTAPATFGHCYVKAGGVSVQGAADTTHCGRLAEPPTDGDGGSLRATMTGLAAEFAAVRELFAQQIEALNASLAATRTDLAAARTDQATTRTNLARMQTCNDAGQLYNSSTEVCTSLPSSGSSDTTITECARPACGQGTQPQDGECIPDCNDLRRRSLECHPFCDADNSQPVDPSTTDGAEQSSGDGLVWLWAVLGVVVVGSAVGVVLRRRRRFAVADRLFKGGARTRSIARPRTTSQPPVPIPMFDASALRSAADAPVDDDPSEPDNYLLVGSATTTDSRPDEPAQCSYPSGGDRVCQRRSTSFSPQRLSHTCEISGCTEPKSSSETFCAAHIEGDIYGGAGTGGGGRRVESSAPARQQALPTTAATAGQGTSGQVVYNTSSGPALMMSYGNVLYTIPASVDAVIPDGNEADTTSPLTANPNCVGVAPSDDAILPQPACHFGNGLARSYEVLDAESRLESSTLAPCQDAHLETSPTASGGHFANPMYVGADGQTPSNVGRVLQPVGAEQSEQR